MRDERRRPAAHLRSMAEAIVRARDAPSPMHRSRRSRYAPLALATLEWVAWFNHHRLLEPIGDIPPAEAEANDDRQLASQPAAVAV